VKTPYIFVGLLAALTGWSTSEGTAKANELALRVDQNKILGVGSVVDTIHVSQSAKEQIAAERVRITRKPWIQASWGQGKKPPELRKKKPSGKVQGAIDNNQTSA
jgi:hypothetical protein